MPFLMVGLGGFMGAILRYSIYTLVPQSTQGFPFGTFSVNFLGCLIAGVAYGIIPKLHLSDHPLVYIGVIGFLGSFTTFSAVAVDSLLLAQMGRYQVLTWHLSANFVVCIAMVFVGNMLGLSLRF